MTEAPAEKTPAPPAEPPQNNKLEITQEALNELMGKTRTETRAQSEKEIAKLKADYEEKLRLASLKEEERVKAEQESAAKKLNDELTAARRELAMKSAEAELAKLSLDPALAGIVLGKDADETAKNIAALKKQVDAMVKKLFDANIKAGAPERGGTAGGSADNDALRKAAGLPPKK